MSVDNINTPSRIDTPSKEKHYSSNQSTLDDVLLEDKQKINGRQLDIIAANVNRTIQDLNLIYHDIGYSTTEISIKKAEIFTVLEDTIHNFTSSLQREKSNIDNECEWLRQQIRIILAMINDSQGIKNLTELNRGIVFKDHALYEKGFKDEIIHKLSILQNRRENFYEDSPFNVTNNSILQEFSFENEYKSMLNNVPTLSLLKLKSRLNSIFLDALKLFIKSFKKLNFYNLAYIDSVETIGELPNHNTSILKYLPNKADAESHKELIDQFESTIRRLRLTDMKSSSFLGLNDETNSDNIAFIISSPTKTNPRLNNNNENNDESIDGSNYQKSNIEDLMGHLRDINYKIVRAIRGLKITKINSEFLNELNQQVELCEAEFERRRQRMDLIIDSCFQSINQLDYTEEQLIQIQKQFNGSQGIENGEGYFDKETLKFIQENPREFGLNDVHLKFVENFEKLIQKIKESKQKKWGYYMTNCKILWTKLNEDQGYIDNFILSNNNLNDNSLTNFKMELNRLYTKRSEFIDNFIVDARNEIEDLWSRLFYTEDQKSQFKYYQYDPNESLDKEMILNEHELELNNLQQEFSSKESMIDKYNQIRELISDQNFLLESSKDSSRLLSKNSCKILLNEERIRKRIMKNLPKLIESLKNEVIEFNHNQLNEGKKPFKIYNEDFFEKLLIIEAEQSNRNQYKRNQSPKKISPTKPVSQRQPPLPRNSPITKPSPSRVSRRPSPLLRQSPNKVQPKLVRHNNPHRQDRFNNMNSSISKQSINSSQMSPVSNMVHKDLGESLSKPSTKLQPLNSPLIPSQSTLNSSPNQKLSPINIDNKLNVTPKKHTPKQSQPSSSPQRTFLDEDKENNSFNDLKLGLTPIKVDLNTWEHDTSTPTSDKRDTIDSSMIGEDYQQWRTEKIKQLNL